MGSQGNAETRTEGILLQNQERFVKHVQWSFCRDDFHRHNDIMTALVSIVFIFPFFSFFPMDERQSFFSLCFSTHRLCLPDLEIGAQSMTANSRAAEQRFQLLC